MAFAVEFVRNTESNKFVVETNIRLRNPNFLQNPFYGIVKYVEDFCIVEMKPLWFNMAPVGLVIFIASVYFRGFSLWNLPGLIILSSGLFWSHYFMYLMFRIGIRKAGYRGPIKLLKHSEALRRLADGTA